MAIEEIFPNPTVKQVIFQIRFPNLFYIENKIGEFQVKIMKEFPESSFFIKRNLLFVDTGEEEITEEISKKLGGEPSRKVWQFRSKNKTVLNILSDSLDITSEFYKTYDLDSGEKFRDAIKFILDNFIETVSIPIIERIGLRYIDECPLPSKDNTTLKSYYNSTFPIDRFDISGAEKMDFITAVRKNGKSMNYRESLVQKGQEWKIILDFDCFDTNIDSHDYLETTDNLHKIISEEYEKTINKPVYEYMRGSQEE